MRQTRQRLVKTGLFTDVRMDYEDAPAGSGGGQILHVRVREAENLVLGLGGGYDTVNGQCSQQSVCHCIGR